MAIDGVDVDVNASGLGIATWGEDADASGTGNVWIAWHSAGAWGSPVQVSDPSVHAILPRVALNDAGDAVVAYEVVEHGAAGAILSRTVWARRYTGGSWRAAERLCLAPPAPNVLYASRPRLGIDASGNALAVWHQQNQQELGGAFTIQASRFNGSAWSAPFAVSGGTTNALWPDAAVSAGGRAAVVWAQDTSASNPADPNMRVRVFSGTAWADPQVLNTALAAYEHIEHPAVTLDGAGRAFAIWEEHRGVNGIALASLDASSVTTWSVPTVLASSSSASRYLSNPVIATDGNGAALAGWVGDDPISLFFIGTAAHLDAGSTTWSVPFDFDKSAPVGAVAVAMDASGAGWAFSATTTGWLRARRRGADGTWAAATVIGTIGTGGLGDAAANATGAVLVGSSVVSTATSAPYWRIAAQGTAFVP